jgi:adenosylmethionine-8-amino-7-oxononanoate aminotransferase
MASSDVRSIPTEVDGLASPSAARRHATDRILPRDFRRTFPRIVRGEGIRLWDEDGREYIDADSGAISVISVGHGVTEVVDAMAAQARRVAYVHNGQFQHDVGEELAREIAEMTPGELNRCLLVSGGSEAVETAVKLARHYQLLRGNDSKHIVLSRARGYHGATLVALSLSGIPVRQASYLPLLRHDEKVVESNCYRCPLGLTYPGCALACANDLERAIEAVGAENVAAFIAEPVVGAASPAITAPPGYFERIRAICDEHDILFIADEVVTGFGRTGRNFGIDHWGVVPDVIVTAKGLSGGYVPLAAVIMSEALASVFEDADTPFNHNFTYEAHPVACAAALAVIRIIRRDGLVQNAAVQGERLFARLEALAREIDIIGDVRGKGLLAGVEIVADQRTKQAFPLELGVGSRLQAAAQQRGLMIYPGAGADGIAGDQVLLSPPLIVTESDVDEIVDRFALALADVRADLPAAA